MTKIQIDNQASDCHANMHSKVSEVVTQVLTSLPPNRIITKVILDGTNYNQRVDIKELERNIEEIRQVEIQTADKEIWAATGLDISITSIEKVQRSLIRTAEMFRESDKARANKLFVQCVEGLERFIETVTITRLALNLNFDLIQYDGYSLTRIESELNQILKGIVSLQEKTDYQGLADKIEYELLTNLVSWMHALKQCQASRNSNA